jgi:hypothetical protein
MNKRMAELGCVGLLDVAPQLTEALFSLQNFLGSAIVTLSFVFNNYCSTID